VREEADRFLRRAAPCHRIECDRYVVGSICERRSIGQILDHVKGALQYEQSLHDVYGTRRFLLSLRGHGASRAYERFPQQDWHALKQSRRSGLHVGSLSLNTPSVNSSSVETGPPTSPLAGSLLIRAEEGRTLQAFGRTAVILLERQTHWREVYGFS
jgi:hypothetical protein